MVADLERRLALESRRSAALTERLDRAKAAIAEQRAARASADRENAALRRELAVIETSLQESGSSASGVPAQPWLDGITLLYVGGHPNQVAHLRGVAAVAYAGFMHHGGGIEHHLSLLAGLVSQANLVVFPVDCISHHAARIAKQLCRQAGKRFIPLRSASVASLLAALRRPAVAGLADPAD